jgi:hypothetical protein
LIDIKEENAGGGQMGGGMPGMKFQTIYHKNPFTLVNGFFIDIMNKTNFLNQFYKSSFFNVFCEL